MADANLKSCTAHPERHVTIQQSWRYQRFSLHPQSQPPLYPRLRLARRWLETASFQPGQRVRIEVHHGRLVITLTSTCWAPPGAEYVPCCTGATSLVKNCRSVFPVTGFIEYASKPSCEPRIACSAGSPSLAVIWSAGRGSSSWIVA